MLPSVSNVTGQVVATPSTCVPVGAIVLTLFNSHHTGLYELQFSRVREQACLMQRLISVCFGEDACRLALGRKVRGEEVPASNFRTAAYVELTWAKWRLMHEALSAGARTVLFVDTDVVLFKNPFTSLAPDANAYDLLFQAELACPATTTSCRSQPAWRATLPSKPRALRPASGSRPSG